MPCAGPLAAQIGQHKKKIRELEALRSVTFSCTEEKTVVELPAGQFVRAEELSSSLVMYWHPPVEGGVLACRGAVERRSVKRTKSLLRPYLYAVGGWNDDDDRLSSVERYDEEKDEWEAVADMSTARFGAGACVLGGRLYAVGGCDDYNNLSSVERYDE